MSSKRNRQKTRIEDIRRIELIEAAHRIFLKEGLRGLTTTRICHEAGMSQGILTYYFRDKEEVLFEMVRRNNRILAEQVMLNLKRATTGYERVIAVIDGLFPPERFDRATANAWASLFAEAAHNERYRRLLTPYYRRLHSNLAAPLKAHMPRPDVDRFIRGFTAMVDGLWLRRGYSDDDMWLEEAKGILVEYVERSLGAGIIGELKSRPA